MVRLLFTISIFLATTPSICKGLDSLLIENISSELTEVKQEGKGEQTIYHLKVQRERLTDAKLKISSPELFSIFRNNQLIFSGKEYGLTFDELPKDFKKEWLFTIFMNAKQSIEVELIRVNKNREIHEVLAREKMGISSFINSMIVFFLIMFSLIKAVIGKEINEYFRIGFIFSIRNRDENLFRNKLRNPVSVVFLLMIIGMSAFIMVLYQAAQLGAENTLGVYVVDWLYWVMIISVLMVLKVLILNVFSFIFKFNKFLTFHYFNYLRITLLVIMVLTVISIGMFWNNFADLLPITIDRLILLFFIIRSFFLFLKLINELHFKFFHLFSYLCATEIIPFFGMLYLAKIFVF